VHLESANFNSESSPETTMVTFLRPAIKFLTSPVFLSNIKPIPYSDLVVLLLIRNKGMQIKKKKFLVYYDIGKLPVKLIAKAYIKKISNLKSET
jgi:hypothetical protein